MYGAWTRSIFQGRSEDMFFLTQKQLYRRVDQAIDQVKHGIYRRLIKEYLETMDLEDAGLLAAAVTNHLFSLPSANRDGKIFLEKNRNKVNRAVQNLKNNEEILHAINLTLRHRQKILFDLLETGRSSGAAINLPLDNLEKMGLLVDMGELPDIKKFLKYARKFFQKSPD